MISNQPTIRPTISRILSRDSRFMGVKLHHQVLPRVTDGQFVEGHISQGIAGVVVRINRDPRVLAILVGGPSVTAEFFYQVHGILGDMKVKPLHDVNPLPYRIGSLARWLDIESEPIDFLDAFGFC